MKYSIVIPAYNEGQRLAASLEKILAYASREGWAAEILVVNDGSRDATAELVRSFASQHPEVRLLENPGNRGKGYSVRHGMLKAQGELLLFTDADLSSPIAEAGKLFQAIEDGADLAMGSRWLNSALQTERQPLLRQLYGRLFNLLLRVVLGLNYRDTQCGFKAFNRAAAQAIFPLQRIERWGFDPEILFIAGKRRLRVTEVAVEWAHDHGSKINPLRDGMRMLLEVLSIRWNWMRGRYRTPKPTPADAATAVTEEKRTSVA